MQEKMPEEIAQFNILMDEVVNSSNIAKIGFYQYNELLGVLEVEFKNGGRYRYRGIPEALYDEFEKSGSKGAFLAKNIKGKFDCWKFEDNEIVGK